MPRILKSRDGSISCEGAFTINDLRSETLSPPNLVINGDARISQRGIYISPTPVANGDFWVDRWQALGSDGSLDGYSVLGSNDVQSGQYGYRGMKVASGRNFTGILGVRQNLLDEKYLLEGTTVTFGCWMRSNTSNARLLIRTQSGVVAATDTAPSSETWTFLTQTVTLAGSLSTLWLEADFAGAAGQDVSITSSDYFDVTDLFLVPGDSGKFYPRHITEELALCQRFFHRVGLSNFVNGTVASSAAIAMGQADAATSARFIYNCPVPMRTTPSFSASGITGSNITCTNSTNGNLDISAITANQLALRTQRLNLTCSSGLTAGHATAIRIGSTNVELDFNAEL